MKIPNDTGGNWRKNKLIEYIGSFPDEIGPVMRRYFLTTQADKDQQVWWVLLYSACYCMGTACVLAEELDYKTLKPKQLRRFWEENKPRLIFQSDRRYIKNMNQFNDIVAEFIKRSHRQPWSYISQFIKNTPQETYKALYSEVSSWKYYGRFGTILFLYNLNKLLGVELDSTDYDWKTGKTTTAAIFNAYYEDDKADDFEADGKLTQEQVQFLDTTLQKVIKILKKRYPDKVWTIMGVTSDLCSYRKLFKQSRYLGYYVDRQQEELIWLQKQWPEYSALWQDIWGWRQEFIDPQYLGELQGWSGVQKERMKSWAERGEFR